jgi:hypothetical protein
MASTGTIKVVARIRLTTRNLKGLVEDTSIASICSFRPDIGPHFPRYDEGSDEWGEGPDDGDGHQRGQPGCCAELGEGRAGLLGEDQASDKTGEGDDTKGTDAYLKELVQHFLVFVRWDKSLLKKAQEKPIDIVHA